MKKIIFAARSGKSPPVRIPIELWCRLCDALALPPDSSQESIVKKAELLRSQLVSALHEKAITRTAHPSP